MPEPATKKRKTSASQSPSKSLDAANREYAAFSRKMGLIEAMIPMLGKLYRTQNVVCTLFSKRLNSKSASEILKTHAWAVDNRDADVTVAEIHAVLEVMASFGNFVRTMRVDLGKCVQLCRQAFASAAAGSTAQTSALRDVLSASLKAHAGALAVAPSTMQEARDVVLYGFGRIGRLMMRILVEKAGSGVKLMLRAIVVRKKPTPDLLKRASLLLRDSVHGPFNGTVEVNEAENAIVANGVMVRLLYSASPDRLDYTQHGIQRAIVVDNTGIWRDKKGLSLHLASKGVAAVLLTAPGKGGVPNVVMGVNDEECGIEDWATTDVVSAASCSTNCIAPALKALHAAYGVKSGHVETVHAFTNDQNLIDNFHKKKRRGRSAALNIVLTETGAAEAVQAVLPELAGRLTASAIRVPTPNVSMALMVLQLDAETDAAAVNALLKAAATSGRMQQQIDYVEDDDVCSSDFVGNRAACIVDARNTRCAAGHGGSRLNLYLWYDNEFGYSCQVVRILQKMAGIVHPRFPTTA
jgi:glyceraldehyde 3-phosphate dehydrogenase